MFRVTFFVDDKKLGECLHGLAGLAQGTPEVVPVVNAVAGANGSGPRAMTDSGKLVDMFADWLRKTKRKELRASDAREFMKSIGMSEASYTYMLGKARDQGLLKKTGTGTTAVVWKVVPAKTKRNYKAEHARRKRAASSAAAS
jgi:hypothetical protein